MKAGVEDMQSEFQQWFDDLPENLQSSATGEKLEAVIERCQYFIDALEEVEIASNDMDGADLPVGFGRD